MHLNQEHMGMIVHLMVSNLTVTIFFSFPPLLFSVCLDKCKHGACSLQGQCCHEQCLGGCSEPGNASSCVACRNLQHGSTCVEKCPSGYHVFRGWRCVSFSFCQVGSNWCIIFCTNVNITPALIHHKFYMCCCLYSGTPQSV